MLWQIGHDDVTPTFYDVIGTLMQIVVDAAGYMSDAGISQPCPDISDVHGEQAIDLPNCGIYIML